MTNNRKKLTGIISIGLLILIGIAGTYAFLTDTTPTKANTFTVGKVGITLAEPEWDKEGASHKIIPGVTLAKDPTVTVTSKSEDAYVFIELDFSTQLAEHVAFYTINYNDTAWELISETGTKKVYGYKTIVAASQTDTVLPALFTTISFADTLTAENLEQLKEAKINVTGHAIQASGLADSAAAWAALTN